MSEEGILASQRCGIREFRASGRKALLAATIWSGRIGSGSTRGDRDRISTVTPAGSVIFCRRATQFSAVSADEKRAKGENVMTGPYTVCPSWSRREFLKTSV